MQKADQAKTQASEKTTQKPAQQDTAPPRHLPDQYRFTDWAMI